MSRRRLIAAAAAALIAGIGCAVGFGVGQADAAGDTIYSRTVVGSEFRPLDFRVFAQFAAGSGGGVYTHVPSGDVPPQVYLEAPVDLPVGASVVSVSFYYFDCGFPDPLAKFYFGVYGPLYKSYSDIQSEGSGGSGTCFHTYTLTRTQPKVPAVKENYRYILGVHALYSSTGATLPPDGPPWVLSGARVRFTCARGCLP